MKFYNKVLSGFMLTLLFTLFSCGEDDGSNEVYKPSAIGTQGQLLVVMNTQLWNGKMGDLAKEYLAPEIKYYPQLEYLFDITHNSNATFRSSTKRHKNIVQFEINDHPEIRSEIVYLDDVWAKGQVVIKVIGKSQQDLAQLFVDNAQDIQDYLMNKEISRLKEIIEQNKNHLVERELQEKHHLSVVVPMDMELTNVNNETCVVLQRKRLRSESGSAGDIQQYLIIYNYPYVSDQIWNKEHHVSVRDSVVKKYFKGITEDSYMITAPDSLASVFVREKRFRNNIYSFEMRGMYSMVNDYRGGPFISTSLVDEKRNRVITIEGHVFAPKFSKREFMMELETMINSLSLY